MLSCFNGWFEDLGCYYFLVAVGLSDQERTVNEVVTGWDGKGPFLLNELSSKKHHTINIWWAILFIHSLSLSLSLSLSIHTPPTPSCLTFLFLPPSLPHLTLHCYINLFFFLAMPCACGILVPWPGIEPMIPALGAHSLNHWTTRKVPILAIFDLRKWQCHIVQPNIHILFINVWP